MVKKNTHSLNIDFLIKNVMWKSFIVKREVCSIVNYVIEMFQLKKFASSFELSILLTDAIEMKKMNNMYRGIDKSTDVIALAINNFVKNLETSLYGNVLMLGDIIMSFEDILEKATKQDKSFSNHFYHLLVHSLLHLIGYDHQNAKEAKKMEKLEIDILSKFGISSPYII